MVVYGILEIWDIHFKIKYKALEHDLCKSAQQAVPICFALLLVFFKITHFLLEFCVLPCFLLTRPPRTVNLKVCPYIHPICTCKEPVLPGIPWPESGCIPVLIFQQSFKTSKDGLKRRESIVGKLDGWVLPIQSSTLPQVLPKKVGLPAKLVFSTSQGEF
jgi:hypothetical protein